MHARIVAAAAAVLLGAVGWAAGASSLVAATATVRITAGLDPASLTIAPGDTVTWRNDDTQRHRIRATSGPGQFDSGDLDPGQSFSVTLFLEGTYAYRDERNKDASAWWGTVTVSSAPTPPPTTGPTPPPGATPTPTPAPTPTVVSMAGRAFSPAGVTIPTGGQVTWRNDDSRDHTVTSTGAFDSGVLPVGATYTRAFVTPGTFAYLCLIHPDMTGTVTVTGTAPTPPPGATPTPTPTPAPTPVPGAGDIAVVDFAYQPAGFIVDPGATVVFVNRGQAAHTITARDGSFGSPLLVPGATWRQTFNTPGTFAYLCTLHPEMAATIQVRGAGGAVPPTPVPTPAPSPVPDQVAMLDFSFGPQALTVPAGTTVIWTNSGVAPHTATQTGGGFNSGFIQPGGRWAWTFATEGTFDYICAIHPQMTGVVRVAAAGSGGTAGTDPSAPATQPAAAPRVATATPPIAGPGAAQPAAAGGRDAASAPATAAGPPAVERSPLWGVLAGALIAGALVAGLRVVQDVGRRADEPGHP